MTVVLETYHSCEGTRAALMQDKNSESIRLEVYTPIDNTALATSVFSGTYLSKSSARHAMKRYGTGWKKEEA